MLIGADKIIIDGALVNPAVNISTNIQFEPLNASGSSAAAAPDFSMTTAEVVPVTRTMRAQGWLDACLYNQETGEHLTHAENRRPLRPRPGDPKRDKSDGGEVRVVPKVSGRRDQPG
jgi:hypothetical protein